MKLNELSMTRTALVRLLLSAHAACEAGVLSAVLHVAKMTIYYIVSIHYWPFSAVNCLKYYQFIWNAYRI